MAFPNRISGSTTGRPEADFIDRKHIEHSGIIGLKAALDDAEAVAGVIPAEDV